MRTSVFFSIVLFLSFERTNAQDTLSLKGSESILVHVLEDNDSLIKYTLQETSDTNIHTIEWSKVQSLRYFDSAKNDKSGTDSTKAVTIVPIVNWKLRGEADAFLKYNGEKCGSFWVGLATALGTPYIGWIPALIVASVPPSKKNLCLNDYSLYQNEEYKIAYRKKAHQIKKRKIWTTYMNVTKVYAVIFCILLLKDPSNILKDDAPKPKKPERS